MAGRILPRLRVGVQGGSPSILVCAWRSVLVMKSTPFIALLAVSAAAAVSPGVASASVEGSYRGKAIHPVPTWAPDALPYESNLVIRLSTHRGGVMRLTGIVGRIKMFCGEASVTEVSVSKVDFRGPRVGSNGSFAYRTKGITFEGQARKGWLTGVAHGGNQECGIEGVKFRLRRQRTL